MEDALLSIKILEESKSLRPVVGVWITQLAVGIYNMLHRAQKGIKSFFKEKINKKEEIMSLQLSLEL